MIPSPERLKELHQRLRRILWAEDRGIDHDGQHLCLPTGPLPTPLAHSNASGRSLVSNGQLGIDLIRLAGGDGFVPHTHPGDHLLICVAGEGTVTYGGAVYPTRAGQVYMIEGEVPHAVGAISDHLVLAVDSPHKPIDSPERMTPVEYAHVLADVGDLTCLVCEITAKAPRPLCQYGCCHCPCYDCNS